MATAWRRSSGARGGSVRVHEAISSKSARTQSTRTWLSAKADVSMLMPMCSRPAEVGRAAFTATPDVGPNAERSPRRAPAVAGSSEGFPRCPRSRSSRWTRSPIPFSAIAFGISTDATDPQSGKSVPAPGISFEDGKITGQPES